MTYLVDTYALVWFLEGNPHLSMAAPNALSDGTTQIVIPTIALAEITFLYARHRIAIDLPRVLAHVARAANCLVDPLDGAVVERLPTTLNIHDAIILATALVFRHVLSKSTIVVRKMRTSPPVAWSTYSGDPTQAHSALELWHARGVHR